MLKRRSQLLTASFLVCDLFMTLLAWCGAYYVRFDAGLIPITKAQPDPALLWANLPLVLLLAAFSFHVTGQYAIHRLRRLREEVIGVVKGVTLLALLALASTFFRHDPYESRAAMVLFWAAAFVLVLTARRLAWAVVRTLRSRGYNQTYSLIVGVGRVARKTARALRKASWMGIKNVGFVEDRPGPMSGDLDVVGAIADLPHLIAMYSVGNVFIALPLNRYADARRVFDVLSQSLVEVRLVADVPNLAGLSLTTTNLDGLPVVGLRESPHFGLNVVFKRLMDMLLSLIGLIVLSPLLLLIAALVKLTSPGPVFYRQERCGLNGRAFHMLKFRSMAADAERQTGAVWAAKNDARRTWFGAFLRRTSIDELPQLFNVLRGDMSLVGPRPERPVFIQQFKKTIPNYMARHCVKAGITGWCRSTAGAATRRCENGSSTTSITSRTGRRGWTSAFCG